MSKQCRQCRVKGVCDLMMVRRYDVSFAGSFQCEELWTNSRHEVRSPWCCWKLQTVYCAKTHLSRYPYRKNYSMHGLLFRALAYFHILSHYVFLSNKQEKCRPETYIQIIQASRALAMATDVVEVLEDAIAMDEIQSAAEAFARLS